ncbi:hypothetical protein M406DRAFT_285362 [Cryphonectria parasitica EP155]|uniref:Zn(2)-C6 fungal-type domain-containing protein n=1 Tax=Cryphonectria parasitica (strain ATCC 38755 / EP155) TaxID=660469 RepID=A0A9P4YCN4_CRYP1|nr:uncharacterized protein M406DRAFT_285362 [Cryphonectria parasitica EP155]KAF3770620.1 hypothetical protein M406DRAFT_285362 [Cryphonectria parasitica EP155]
MAGPGGGPPRRSHTKSRKGCETCKKRHIRCDENFPQCKNCTKHKIRCPYNDLPIQEARPNGPANLMWDPEIEAVIDQWRRTGFFPFPDLQIVNPPMPENYTVEELRLIHHVASISNELSAWGANGFTLWTRQIPTILGVGAVHRFVMEALLAFSAEHISNITGCPMVGKMAFEHRGRALMGVSKALNAFCEGNSDAILAASMVLSWQATDWRSWTQHMQGTRGVIDQMGSWKHKSQFGDFISETITFPTAPASPSPDHKPKLPGKDDSEAFNNTLAQLQKLEIHLKQSREDTKLVVQLISFLKGTRKVDQSMAVADQFERLKPLREWLFWLPVMHLRQTHASPNALVVIAYYYTVAVLMERMFPEIGAAYFGNLAIGPLEEIDKRLVSHSVYDAEGYPEATRQLMSFARDMVREFRVRMGWFTPSPSPFSAQEDFVLPMTSAPLADGLPYSGNPIFSYSTENLSIKSDSSVTGVPSPVAMPSPYSNQQYLKIPPPMAGCYSPVSSTCEASSIGDEFSYETSPIAFNSCNMGYNGSLPQMGGPYDFGFVTPIQIQPLWN